MRKHFDATSVFHPAYVSLVELKEHITEDGLEKFTEHTTSTDEERDTSLSCLYALCILQVCDAAFSRENLLVKTASFYLFFAFSS